MAQVGDEGVWYGAHNATYIWLKLYVVTAIFAEADGKYNVIMHYYKEAFDRLLIQSY